MPSIAFALPKPNSLIVITVLIDGPTGQIEARLVLDTGATHTFISPGFFKAVGYDPFVQKKETVITGSGRADIWPIEVSTFTVLDFPIKKFRLYAQQFPPTLQIDGVLGLNVFRRMRKTLKIDFQDKILELC
jgi:hypothetical protein